MKIGVLILVAIITCQTTFAQSFYKDYQSFLTNNHQGKMKMSRKIDFAKRSTDEIKKAFNTVEKKTGIKMLNCHKLFLVSYSNGMSGKFSMLIWNKNHSCSYYQSSNSDVTNKITVKTNASTRLDSLNSEFRMIVEKADTAAYAGYVKKRMLPEDTSVKFCVANRTGKHWQFISSKSFTTSKPD